MEPEKFNEEKDIFDLSQSSISEIFYEVNEKKTPLTFIKQKSHVRYLQDYLGKNGLDATFAVAERGYINKDYLTDYSLYYSSCFAPYHKECTRLHFFSVDTSKKAFTALFNSFVVGANNENIQGMYLGYIVVKPIPNYFIGFTLLKHFNFNEQKNCYAGSRKFWGIKNYDVHIFGNELTINSLAFQEQDKNVAACATIAIWSMLQRAAEDYYVVLRSPIEITHQTGITAHDGNRLIPNKGLSILQMANAITKNNMVTEAIDYQTHQEVAFNSYLKRIIHAYSSMKIPIILALEFPSEDGGKKDGHAVAIAGYNMESISFLFRTNGLISKIIDKFRPAKATPNITMMADRITKIYAHDDQWGPFSKMTFCGKRDIRSSWDSDTKNRPCQTQSVLISVFPKIRISYDYIEPKVHSLHGIICKFFDNNIIWNIQLFLSEDFKEDVRQNSFSNFPNEKSTTVKYTFLTRIFPKYVWVATLLDQNEEKIYDFVYDATGLSDSNLIHTILCHSSTVTSMLKDILNNENEELSGLLDYDVESYKNAIIG